MMTTSSIQEGGCTTQPPVHRALVGADNIMHAAAAISPAGAVGVIWGATLLGDPGSPARTPVFGVVVIGAALVLSFVTLRRARTRPQRTLAIVGLAGNLLLFAFGLLRTTISS